MSSNNPVTMGRGPAAQRRAGWRMLVLLAGLLGILPAGPAAAKDDGVTDYLTVERGAYVIDMGQALQTFGNGLKPYGLVFDLVVRQQIPLLWAIAPGKAKDGIDFSVDSRDFRGGSFIVQAQYAAAAAPVIATWQAKGVVVYGPTVNDALSVPVYDMITSFPRAALDDQNGSIAQGYLVNAEIDSSFYYFKDPAELNACDDVYTMPHADPAWETHSNLLSFNQQGGGIWAACHAVSVLENVDDPDDPDSDPDMNFLSNNGLVDFGDHDDGTIPYSYAADDHPIMQFLGNIDAGTESGSEQIYLPAAAGWRGSTRIAMWDPDHPDIPGLSPGEAAKIAYGRGFGSSTNGYVMYEGGHSHNKGSGPEFVGAQRAYLNFLLLAGIDRRPEIEAVIPDVDLVMDGVQLNAGEPVGLSTTVTGGAGLLSYVWTSSCGGSFDNPYSSTPMFTPPLSPTTISCILRVTVNDSCSRRVFEASPATVYGKPDLALSKTDSTDPAITGQAFDYTLTVENLGGPATGVTLTDTLPAEVAFLSASAGCSHSGEPLGGTVTCALGDIGGGANESITITVTAPATAATLSNTASVTTPDGDLDLANNTATEPTLVRPGTDLAMLSKSVSPGAVGIDDEAVYTLSVRNNGPLDATNVVVTDPLPAGLAFVSANGSGWSCSYSAASGTVQCVRLALAVDETAPDITIAARATVSGSLVNTATVGSPDFADLVPANDSQGTSLDVQAAADLAVIKSTDKLDAGDGSTLNFYLDIVSNGTDTTDTVVVTDTLPYSVDKNNAAGFHAFCQGDNYFFTGPGGTRIQGNKTDATRTYTVDGVTIQVGYSGVDCGDPNSADPLAPLPADGSTVQIVWTVTPGLAAGQTLRLEFEAKKESDVQAPNNASVSSGITDPVAANNSDTIRVGKTDGTADVSYADLEIQKTAALNPLATDNPIVTINSVDANADFGYLISLRNNGPTKIPRGDATKGFTTITFSDVLPAGVSYRGFAELGTDVAHAIPDGGLVATGSVQLGTWGCGYDGGTRTVTCTYTLDQGNDLDAERYVEDLVLLVSAPASGTGITNTAADLSLAVPPAVSGDTWVDPYDHNDRSSWTLTLNPPQLDLAVSKSVAPMPTTLGEEVTYTVTVSNDAGYAVDASSVAIDDPLPTGLTLVSRTVSQGLYSGSTWVVGGLASGASATMTVVATVDTLAALTNTASLSGLDQQDVNADNDRASATVDLPNADLSLAKTVDNPSPPLGSSITFTLTVTNDGPDDAVGTQIAQVLDQVNPGFVIVDPATDIVAVDGTAGFDPATRALTWDIGTLANGATATLNVAVRVDGSGDIVNTAVITSTAQPDGNDANDSASVTVAVQSADLVVTKTVSPDKAAMVPYSPVTFTVSVTNQGPRDVTGVELTDQLPVGLIYQSDSATHGSYSDASGIWAVGTLAAGETAVLTIQAQATVAGALVNTATVTASSTVDPNPNNDSASVTFVSGGEADIYLTKSSSVTASTIGASFDFVVEAVNYGPDDATNLRVDDLLPVGLVYLGDVAQIDGAPAGSYDPATGHWDIGTLAKDSIARLTLTVKAEQSGAITNTARVGALDQADPDPFGDQASKTVVIAPGVSVAGTVWADADHDGALDGGESGISGVAVILYDVAADSCRSVQTDGAGRYRFTGVVDGGYRLIEAAGESVPTAGACPPAAADPSGHVSTTTNVRLVNVAGLDIKGQDFGDYAGSKLTGRFFEDNGAGGTAHDGAVDTGESGLAGLAVVVRNAGGDLDAATTAADGGFVLWVPGGAGAVEIVASTSDGYLSVSESVGTTGATNTEVTDDLLGFTPAAGTHYSGILFGDIRAPVFEPDNSATALPNTVVFHQHRFTAHTAGDVSFSIATATTSPALDGWSPVLLEDLDCDGNADRRHDGAVGLDVDGASADPSTVCLLVKVFVPADVPANAQYRLEVQADFALAGITQGVALSRSDLTLSGEPGEAGLELLKAVDKDAAAPGDVLTYTISYRNTSQESLTQIVLHDTVTAYTTLAAPVGCPGGLPANLVACSVTLPAPAANLPGYVGDIEWTMSGQLAPGAAGEVQYRVLVEP